MSLISRADSENHRATHDAVDAATQATGASASARQTEVRDLLEQARALRRVDYDRVLSLAERAFATAERIRTAIAARSHDFDGGAISVTASLGVASVTPPESATLEMLIERADRALYAAKRGGRNLVVADTD